MARRRNVRSGVRPIYTFLLSWLFLSAFMPMFLPATFLVSLGLGGVLTYFLGKANGKREQQKECGDEKGFSHCGIVLTGLLTRGLGIGFGRIDRLGHIGSGGRSNGVGSRMMKMDVHLRERDRDVIAV